MIIETRKTILAGPVPLVQLHGAGCLWVLERMYGSVIVTPGVAAALAGMRAGGMYAPDPAAFPWMRLAGPAAAVYTDDALFAAAAEIDGALVLVEPRHARRAAEARGLRATGTLGVLLMAKDSGLVASVAEFLPLLAESGLVLTPKARLTALLLARESL